MSDKTAAQFEQYWRQKISDELYAEHKQALHRGDHWRAVYMVIASNIALGYRRPDPVLLPTVLNSDYHTEVKGRPE